MLRKCSICGELKELDIKNFAHKKTGSGGFDPRCKLCKRAYDQQYYATRRDDISSKKAAYYREHRDKIKAASMARYHRSHDTALDAK